MIPDVHRIFAKAEMRLERRLYNESVSKPRELLCTIMMAQRVQRIAS